MSGSLSGKFLEYLPMEGHWSRTYKNLAIASTELGFTLEVSASLLLKDSFSFISNQAKSMEFLL